MAQLEILESVNLKHKDSGITSKYMKVKIDDFEFSCPYLTSNLSDYKKSHETNIPLESQMFQYYIDQTASNAKPLTDIAKRSSIINAFNKIIEIKNPKITSLNFYYDSRFIDENTRRISKEIQMELNTTFLSDLEPDKNQSVREFESQLIDLHDIKNDQIKCPTISLRTTDSKMFEEKIELIFSMPFKIFNVEWGGITKFKQNILVLSRKLAEKEIVCNMISIKPLRRYFNPLTSNLIHAGLLGSSLVSPGYVRPAGPLPVLLPPGKLFNSETGFYAEAPGARDILHVNSMNSIFSSLQELAVNIRDGNTFENSVPMDYRFN